MNPNSQDRQSNSWTVGQVVVSQVHEQELDPSTGSWLMPDLTTDTIAQSDDLVPSHIRADHTLRMDSHSYALRVGDTNVIVDTGVGNGKTRDNPAWHDLHTDYLTDLAAAGFDPQTIDLVVVTHLHTDHVGWNTTWDGSEWVPTFPNARYVVSETEWSYWNDIELDPARMTMFADSVHPIANAGLLDTIAIGAGGTDVADGLSLRPAPGHTPGHVVVSIDSGGEHAVITGDAIHHPLQIQRPDVTTRADIDPAQTIATRRALIAECTDDRTLVLGTHFAGGSAGRIETVDDGYRFRPDVVESAAQG